eukprot:1395883-Pyramimonas_sp.AAC.1
MEACGGQARTSRLAIRRRLKAGETFDLVTGCDLNDESQQRAAEQCVRQHRPLVAIMAPTYCPY